MREEQIRLNTNKHIRFSKCGCFIVRNRCLKFIEVLKGLGYISEIPLEEAKNLFSLHIGPSDRKSLKAYFGTQATKSIKRIQKIARYSTGTFSVKNIELAQEIPQRKGYFELLGLAKFEQRGPTWFMILTNEPLTPELFPQQYETSEVSMKNFSLPLISPSLNESLIHDGLEEGVTVGETSVSPRTERPTEKPNIETEEKNKQTTTYRGRERNPIENRFLPLNGEKHTRYASICLTPEEEAILNAKPIDSEPDRAKIKWGESRE